jgi:hypothetical protein
MRKVLLSLGSACLLAGCQVAHDMQPPMPAKLLGPAVDDQMEFWHTLAGRKLATNDQAFHGLLLYFDSADPAHSYEERVKLLKSRHWLADDFSGGADEAVTRGTVAVVLVRELRLKGGWVMMLTGASPRYATRELQFRGLYPSGSPNQVFSGTEFVGIIGKLDDFQHGDAPPVSSRLVEK